MQQSPLQRSIGKTQIWLFYSFTKTLLKRLLSCPFDTGYQHFDCFIVGAFESLLRTSILSISFLFQTIFLNLNMDYIRKY